MRALRWLVRYGLADDWMDDSRPFWDWWPTARHVLAFAGLIGLVTAAVTVAWLVYLGVWLAIG